MLLSDLARPHGPVAQRPPASRGARAGNAADASRLRAAGAAARRNLLLTSESALVHGPYRQIGLQAAALLPFNA